MPTIRVNKTDNYTVMSNYHLRDKSLSLKAKGLLSWMLSLPEDWDYSVAGIVACHKEGDDAIRSALKELKDNNYLVISKLSPESYVDENGNRIIIRSQIEYIYNIFEQPMLNQISENQDTGFQHLDFQVSENPAQINTDITNTKKRNNVMDKPLHPATPGLSKHRDKLHRNAQTLTDDLGGISQYEKEDRPKKKNLFTKCSEEIDNTEYQFTDEVKEALREYLPFATDTSSEKRIKGVNMWKGKLKQLLALSKDSNTQVKIVRQSINKGWFCFEPLGKTEYKDKYNRSSSEVKRQELHGDEVIAELKRRAERNGVY